MRKIRRRGDRERATKDRDRDKHTDREREKEKKREKDKIREGREHVRVRASLRRASIQTRGREIKVLCRCTCFTLHGGKNRARKKQVRFPTASASCW